MQYPIIDLITDAYINNGWTGLDISTGKNLFNVFKLVSSSRLDILPNGNITVTGNTVTGGSKLKDCANVLEGETYILSAITTGKENYIFLQKSNTLWYFDRKRTITASDLDSYLFFYGGLNTTSIISNIMIRKSTELDPTYEPYGDVKNDFPYRLKLPLPHYFPHPVIDALQRAAAGTQTADDTEILRHYLTPLGIGGI